MNPYKRQTNMIKINLLSPLDKENLKWEKLNNLAIRNIIWVLAAEMIFAGLFFFALEYLNAESRTLSVQSADLSNSPETREASAIERDLQANKSKVKNIYGVQSGHVKWTPLFENISNMIPAEVRLESISAQADNSAVEAAIQKANKGKPVEEQVTLKVEDKKMKVDIAGNAKSREALIAFEEKLKSSDMFFDVQCNASNYVESSDIDFIYTFYIHEQTLLK